MLGILLLIFKILCVTVLVILCVLLLLIGVLLFVPIKYKSDGSKNEDQFHVHLSASYLSPLLCLKVSYPAPQVTSVKIFGIPYKPKKKARPQETNAQKPVKKKKKKRIRSFVKDIAYYQELWQSNKDLILDVLQTIVKALATLLPKDMHINVMYGTGMADVTGFIYALYCIIESYLPGEVSVEPIWTEKYLEGEYKLSGKIRLFPLVVATIKIISNQNVRILYKKIRRV